MQSAEASFTPTPFTSGSEMSTRSTETVTCSQNTGIRLTHHQLNIFPRTSLDLNFWVQLLNHHYRDLIPHTSLVINTCNISKGSTRSEFPEV